MPPAINNIEEFPCEVLLGAGVDSPLLQSAHISVCWNWNTLKWKHWKLYQRWVLMKQQSRGPLCTAALWKLCEDWKQTGMLLKCERWQLKDGTNYPTFCVCWRKQNICTTDSDQLVLRSCPCFPPCMFASHATSLPISLWETSGLPGDGNAAARRSNTRTN